MANYQAPKRNNDWIDTLNDKYELVDDRRMLEEFISFVNLQGLGDEFLKFLKEQTCATFRRL